FFVPSAVLEPFRIDTKLRPHPFPVGSLESPPVEGHEAGVGTQPPPLLAHLPPLYLDHVGREVVAAGDEAAADTVRGDWQTERLKVADLPRVESPAHDDADPGKPGCVEGDAQPANECRVHPRQLFPAPRFRVADQ